VRADWKLKESSDTCLWAQWLGGPWVAQAWPKGLLGINTLFTAELRKMGGGGTPAEPFATGFRGSITFVTEDNVRIYGASFHP